MFKGGAVRIFRAALATSDCPLPSFLPCCASTGLDPQEDATAGYRRPFLTADQTANLSRHGCTARPSGSGCSCCSTILSPITQLF